MGVLTDVGGLLVGHAEDLAGLTGVTVVLCPAGAVAAVDVRGGAPGTRETDLLRPENMVERVHAIALCGGSAFGLAAATGVGQTNTTAPSTSLLTPAVRVIGCPNRVV